MYSPPVPISSSHTVIGVTGWREVCSEAPSDSSSTAAPGPATVGRVAILVVASGRAQPALTMGAAPEGVKIFEEALLKTKLAGDALHGTTISGNSGEATISPSFHWSVTEDP